MLNNAPGSKETMDVLSIIIVTYNAGATLQKCLYSIYVQTYPQIEIVIIDGASTDNTVQILQKNTRHIAYWKSEKDEGIYDAMNKALNHITGKWVYFLGADDELLPEFSAMAYELKNPNAIYYGNVIANGEKKLGELTTYQLAKVGIYHQAMIYPRHIFDSYNFDIKYKISADFAFNIRCYKNKTIQFIYKDRIIARFNHTGISGTQIDPVFEKDKSALIFENFGFKIWLRYIFRVLKAKIKGKKDHRI